ncbi:MAG: IS21-like element ISFK1 family helper ATPase IstB [Gemmatimonadota bacterium]|nr:MAG: IS21-like element ISFK1 family helper ATPase IstB [Gemmatimonadota bacterium]
MLLEQTFTQLRELRLTGMAAALEEQQAVPDIQDLAFEDRLALLLEREATVREDRRLTRLLRQAKLRLPATIEDLDFRSPRSLDRSVILRLASSDWIRRHQVVLITGATGTGKTYLACALAQAACRQGLSSRYLRLTQLIEDMALARADGSYPKLMNRLQKTEFLAIDDYGLAPLNQTERRDLLEVIEDRTGRRATLIASQLPLEHWHDVIGDATFADAILDRLVHHAHRITLTGPSMRRKEVKTTPPKTVTA